MNAPPICFLSNTWHLHLLRSIVDIGWMNVWCSMVVVPLMRVERVWLTIKNNGRYTQWAMPSRDIAAEKQRSGISYAQERWYHDSGVRVNSQWWWVPHCMRPLLFMLAMVVWYLLLLCMAREICENWRGERWCSEALRVHKLSLYLNLKLLSSLGIYFIKKPKCIWI